MALGERESATKEVRFFSLGELRRLRLKGGSSGLAEEALQLAGSGGPARAPTPGPGKGNIHPPAGQRSAATRALAHSEESSVPIAVDTANGGITFHGVDWRNNYLAIAQKRGITLQVWEEHHLSPGLGGGESAQARRIWLFRLQAGGKEFGVRSAELDGEDARDVTLTLGISDQRRLDLDMLHSENVLHLQLCTPIVHSLYLVTNRTAARRSPHQAPGLQ